MQSHRPVAYRNGTILKFVEDSGRIEYFVVRLDGCYCLHRLYRTFSYCLVTYRRETESLYRRNLWNKPCFLTFEQRGICTLCCETMAKYVQSNEGKERHRKMRKNLSLFGCFKIINTTLDLLITEFGFRNLSWGEVVECSDKYKQQRAKAFVWRVTNFHPWKRIVTTESRWHDCISRSLARLFCKLFKRFRFTTEFNISRYN